LKSRERQERILPLIQQVVGEAALLGIRGPQLLKLIEQAIHDYEENSHDHNSRTFEELR
jgi:hypothetical protein